ncbi:MAG: HNH endonuclease signature motif containing protein [Bacteroidota bacterium]
MRYTRANARNKATKGAYLKERLGAARGGRCERCGYDNYNILQVHHILPRSEGGTNALRNLQLLCPNCHMEVHYGYGTYGGSSR